MPTSNRSIAISLCDHSIDTVFAVIEKLKLFPLVSNQTPPPKLKTTTSSPSTGSMSKRCIVIGLTTLYLRDALHDTPGEPHDKLFAATKESVHCIEVLRNKVNKALDSLLDQRSESSIDKRASYILKIMVKLNKFLTACTASMDVVIDLAQVPSRSKSSFYLNQMNSCVLGEPNAWDLEDLYARLKQHIVSTVRNETLAVLEGDVSSKKSPTFSSPRDMNAEMVREVMGRGNAADHSLFRRKPTRAEIEGFVSRTETTRREPNWKAVEVDRDESTPMNESLPSSPGTPGNTTPSRSVVDSWPFPSPPGYVTASDASSVSSKQAEPIGIEEIYDSYHDHAEDATLGLPGVNTVAALKRQPSHKKSINQIVRVRSESSIGNKRIVRDGHPSTATCSQEPSPRRVEPVELAAIVPKVGIQKSTTMPLSAVRDQYY